MILQYKVVSYIKEDDTQPYVHGYYDTVDVAQRVCDSYNFMWSSHQKMYAKVEHV